MESVTVMHYNEQSSVISQLETETPAGEECLMELSMRKQTFVSLRFSQANPLPVTYHLIDLKDYSLVAGEDNQHACFGYQHSSTSTFIQISSRGHIFHFPRAGISFASRKKKDQRAKKQFRVLILLQTR